jgi:hypothetical protein
MRLRVVVVAEVVTAMLTVHNRQMATEMAMAINAVVAARVTRLMMMRRAY